MKYFDKAQLDNQTIERVEDTLNSLQYIITEWTIKKELRELIAAYQLELLDYYYDRVEVQKNSCDNVHDDCLPF